MIGIGIDTGGTCTDAIIYDLETKEILESCKSQTTHQALEIGIENSIKKLSRNLLEQAKFLSLSTTLATNACVEGKGGRVCMIFIGVKEKTVRESYEQYGFESTDFMRFLDGDVTKNIEPDWNLLENLLPEIFEEYDSIAISQLMARENNGEYEKEAKRRILEKKPEIPVVCAYEIFKDLNAIKRGAGALLNARLIPVMQSFFDAIHKVLKKQELAIPFFVMRSDGSLVSEEYSMQYPVETLLCGPTASAKGAMELMSEKRAIVVDMGGTTTDIALIEDYEPLLNEDGVKVASWETFVKGIEIDTFALGGDTQVCYKDGELFLGNRRVIPISVLAGQYPGILPELEYLCNRPHGSSRAMYEHLLLMKNIIEDEKALDHYSEDEKAILRSIKEGPLSIRQIADAVGKDIFTLKTDRLEKEGIVLRAGFTPSDAMVLKGDRVDSGVNADAARWSALFIANSNEISDLEAVSELVYTLVRERMYCNLVRVLWDHEDSPIPKNVRASMGSVMMNFAKDSFWSMKDPKEKFYKARFSTDAILLGIGAPIHVFINEVAEMLGTKARVSEYSGVSNALGAMLGDVCVYEPIVISADTSAYIGNENVARSTKPIDEDDPTKGTFLVYGPKNILCNSLLQAIEEAREIGEEIGRRKALECGAKSIYHVSHKTKENSAVLSHGEKMTLGATVTVCVRGNFFE